MVITINFVINCGFIFFVTFSGITNILRAIFIMIEKRNMKPYVSCRHLQYSGNNQECGYYKYKAYFEDHNRSCIDCPGKTSITSREAEENLIDGKPLLRLIVRISLICKEIMPYTAVVYSLITAITKTDGM